MADTKPLRKRENTRQRLLDAAVVVFEEKGLAGAKIDDVVTVAGFTRGAFYSNYSSLAELLQEALTNLTARFLEELRTASAEKGGSADIDTLVDIIHTLQPHGRRLYILFAELALHRIRNPESPLGTEADVICLSGEIEEIVGSVLERMGRRPTIDIDQLANILVIFFFDSLFDELVLASGAKKKMGFREMVDMAIQAFSEPSE